MRKVIAAINMTLDGYCDHTAVQADADLHDYYSELIHTAGVLLYGRKTYQLMEYWREVLASPDSERSEYDFAVQIDRVPKLVFSRTLKQVDWSSARLAAKSLKDEVLELKRQPGRDIYASSPSMIVQLTKLGLIDEYELCVHPVLAGAGLPLFKDMEEPVALQFLRMKRTLSSGAVVLCYARQDTAEHTGSEG